MWDRWTGRDRPPRTNEEGSCDFHFFAAVLNYNSHVIWVLTTIVLCHCSCSLPFIFRQTDCHSFAKSFTSLAPEKRGAAEELSWARYSFLLIWMKGILFAFSFALEMSRSLRIFSVCRTDCIFLFIVFLGQIAQSQERASSLCFF